MAPRISPPPCMLLLAALLLLLLLGQPPSVSGAADFSTVFTSKGDCPSNSRLVSYEEASSNTAAICTQLAALTSNTYSLSRLAGGAFTAWGPMCTATPAYQGPFMGLSLCLTTVPSVTFAYATSKQQAAQLVNSDKVMRSLLTASGLGQSSQADLDASFDTWAAFYNYKFQGAALDQARANYQENLRTIATMNSNRAVPHWLGANQFAHLSFNRFGQRPPLGPRLGTRARRLQDLIPRLVGADASSGGSGMHHVEDSSEGWSQPQRLGRATQLKYSVGGRTSRKAAALGSIGAAPGNLPAMKNWVAEGKVTPVRNQYGGQQGNNGCGSCWAFSAVAAIESAYLISKGINVSSQPDLHLSEEQILDCCNGYFSPSISTVSDGCNAGSITEAISYAAVSPLTTSFRIGYSSVNHFSGPGTTGTCDPAAIQRIAAERGQAVQLSGPQGYRAITPKSKTAMMQALAQGPVAVYFVSGPLQLYRGGVYADEGCATSTDHAMLVVGYNTVGDPLDTGGFSLPYWLIKNSFGIGWGELGYVKVAMQDDGTPGICGMYQAPSQVIPSFVPGLDTLYATPPYPSPPPVPPPAPPPIQQWSSKCEPGNTNGTLSFGWTVSLKSVTSTQLTLQVQPNQVCRPSGSACCQSSLQHIQLHVQANCLKSSLLALPLVSSPDGPDVLGSWTDDTLDIVLPGSGSTISSIKTSISITLTVDATNKACPNVPSFFTRFNYDQYSYAAFGNRDQCCGTDVMAPVPNDRVDCQVSWSAWAPCNVACGAGTQTRSGTVTQQPANGGAACPSLSQSQACSQQACPASSPLPPPRSPPPRPPPSPSPIPCQVAWQPWGPCNPTCGAGTQTRSGTVTQQPANGGAACPPLTQTQACNQQACPASPRGSPPPPRPSPAFSRLPPSPSNGALPQTINWVARGMVTDVRQQHLALADGCGSCWAFTAVAAIESAYLIQKGITVLDQPGVHLSEEQVLECCNPDYSPSVSLVSDGCGGGSVDEAIKYVVSTPLTTSSNYPYTSMDHPRSSGTAGTCDPAALKRMATQQGQGLQLSSATTKIIKSNNKLAMIKALLDGPVMIYFDKSGILSYKGGVYNSSECSDIFMDHTMLLVGYNSAATPPYWLIKNQYGTLWGESGYIRVAMAEDGPGVCGMYTRPSQVVPNFVPGLDTLS